MQFRGDGGNGPGVPFRKPAAGSPCSSSSPRGVFPLQYGPRQDEGMNNAQGLSRAHHEPAFPKFFHGGDDQDDAPPSRHLWVGNVSQEVTESLLVERFSKFGPIESVTVYSQRNYAFINFRILDSAKDAKSGLQGVVLGGLAMRIEFAKGAKPSRHLWVGGIGLTVSREQIEIQFNRFGKLEDFKFLRDRNCAFVDYEKMEDAIAAVDSLNRIRIGDEELRVDFGRSQPPKRESFGRNTLISHGDLQTRNGRDHPEHCRASTDICRVSSTEFRQPARGSPDPSFRGPSEVSQAGAGPGASGSTSAKGEKEEPSDVLWVGFPLLSKVDEEGLRRAFVPYGKVERVKTFPGRTYAFVQFKNVQEATRAKDALEGKLFNDPRVHIRFSNSEIGPVDNVRIDGVLSSPSRGREAPVYLDVVRGQVNNERSGSIIAPLRPTGLRPEYYPGGLSRGALAKAVGDADIDLGHSDGKGFVPGGLAERTPLDQVGVRGERGRFGGRSVHDEQWELPEEEIMRREPKRLRMHAGYPEPIHDLSYDGARRNRDSDKIGFSPSSGRHDYRLPSFPNIGGGEEYTKGSGVPRVRSGSVLFEGLRHTSVGQGLALALTTAGPGPATIVKGSNKRESFATVGVVGGLDEGWRWHGTIAKGGTPVCRAQCLPVGKGIDITVPDVVNCTARTDLDMLAKHVYQAGDFGVVFFVPEADPDVPPYHDFMHYLGEKHRAGVAKLANGTTLFLVPPSEFSERVLKVPGKKCLFGVVLKSQPLSSDADPPQRQQNLQKQLRIRSQPAQEHQLQRQRPQQQQSLIHQPQDSPLQNAAFLTENSFSSTENISGLPQGQPAAFSSTNSTVNPSQLASLASGLPTVLTPELIVSLTALLPHQNKSCAVPSNLIPLSASNMAPPTSRVTGQGAPSLNSFLPSSSLMDNRIVHRPSQSIQNSVAQLHGWPSVVSDPQSSDTGLMSSSSEKNSAYYPSPPPPHLPQIPRTSVLQLPLSGPVPAETQELIGSGNDLQQLPPPTNHPQHPASVLGSVPLLPSDQLAQLTALLTQRPQQPAQQPHNAHLSYQHYHQQQPPVHAFSQQQQPLPYHQPQVQNYHQQTQPPSQQYTPHSPSQQHWAQGGPLLHQTSQLIGPGKLPGVDNSNRWDGALLAHVQHQQPHNQRHMPSPTLQSQIPLSQQSLSSGSPTGEQAGRVGQDDTERQNRFQATLQLAAALLQQMQHQQAPGQGGPDQR